MRRLWIVLLAPLLLGTVSVAPVELEPAVPRLGEPLTLSLQLPGGDWELTGYPDLTPFQLLAPPDYAGDRIRLHLLPLRPGKAQIPPFSFYRANLLWQSPPLAVDILDPFVRVETVAPRLPWPKEPSTPSFLKLVLASLLAGLIVGGFLLRRRQPRLPDRLALSSERLAKLSDSARRSELTEVLNGWRFGPHKPTSSDLDWLEEELSRLEGPA